MKTKIIVSIISILVGALQPVIWWAIYCAISRSSFNCDGLDFACSVTAFITAITFIILGIFSLIKYSEE